MDSPIKIALAGIVAAVAMIAFFLLREPGHVKAERLQQELSLARLNVFACEKDTGPCDKQRADLRIAEDRFAKFHGVPR